ncbi:MAG: ACT domain-containing protein [Mobilicoccus sp.]|nr:ACT domain-containing protein [Mobilicoccus sp.]
MTTLVMAFLGVDRPGLLHAIAEVLSDHGGNWEDGRTAMMSGNFTGVVQMSVAPARAEALVEDLRALDGMLDVIVRHAAGSSSAADDDVTFVTLDLVGSDHPGIVEDVTAVLARTGVNVDRLTTSTTDAPMSDGRVFRCQGLLRAPRHIDLDALGEELEDLARDLVVDITLGVEG